MNQAQTSFLLEASRRYIWWLSPEEALQYPQKILAQVMNIGLWEDLCRMNEVFTTQDLLQVLKKAEPGQFNERSWNFWQYRLADCTLGNVPPLPKRKFQ